MSYVVVDGVDGAIVRHLVEQPDFIARLEAVLAADGSPEPRAAAQVVRYQVAANPVVYNQYAPDRLVANITDAAIRGGIARNAWVASAEEPPP